MVMNMNKKSQSPTKGSGSNRLLISITVIGSAGPIRFVVNEGEIVSAVIVTALKSYAREGRFPVLGSDLNDFVLYCTFSGTEALSPSDKIGSFGVRNFMLCKKPRDEKSPKIIEKQSSIPRKGSNRWKSMFNKSLKLKVSTH